MFMISLILLQVITFAGLIYIFRRILNKNITLATRHLEELNQDYSKKQEEASRRLEEAEQESGVLLAKARREAGSLTARVIKEAKDEKEKLLKQARVQGEEIIQQADKSRKQLISELNQRIEKAAIKKACELVQDTLPDEFKQEVHAHWIEDLLKNGFNQLERQRIPDKVQTVAVTSAFPLDKEYQKQLMNKLKTFLGYGVKIEEKIDSKIVAGIVVTIGNLVLDGSLKNKIEEQAISMNKEALESG